MGTLVEWVLGREKFPGNAAVQLLSTLFFSFDRSVGAAEPIFLELQSGEGLVELM